MRGGILYVPTDVVHRVFIPNNRLPASGRKQVLRLLEFLETMGTRDRQVIKTKCATILVEEYVAELVKSQVVPSRRVLSSALHLTRAGCGVRTLVTALEYAKRAFNLQHLPDGKQASGLSAPGH